MIAQIQLGLGNAIQNFIQARRMRMQQERQEQIQQLREERRRQMEQEREQTEAAESSLLQSPAAEDAAAADPQATQAIADASRDAGPQMDRLTQAAAQRQFQQGGPVQQIQAGRALGFSPGQTSQAQRVQQAGEQLEAERDRRQRAAEIWGRARAAASGQDVEAPAAGEIAEAGDILNRPSAQQNAIMTQLHPTEAQERTQDIQRFREMSAIRAANRFRSGEVDPREFARNASMEDLMAASVLEVDPAIRDERAEIARARRSERDLAQTLERQRRDEAQRILRNNDLAGEVSVGTMAKGLRFGFDSDELSDQERADLAPVRDQLSQSRTRERLALVSDLESTPGQSILSTFAQTAMDAGERELAAQYINQKRELARQQSGLSGEQLPYPQVSPDDIERVGSIIPFQGTQMFTQLSFPAEEGGAEDGDGGFTMGQIRPVSERVISQFDGDVEEALREARRNAGSDPTPGQQQTIRILEFMRDSLP